MHLVNEGRMNEHKILGNKVFLRGSLLLMGSGHIVEYLDS